MKKPVAEAGRGQGSHVPLPVETSQRKDNHCMGKEGSLRFDVIWPLFFPISGSATGNETGKQSFSLSKSCLLLIFNMTNQLVHITMISSQDPGSKHPGSKQSCGRETRTWK